VKIIRTITYTVERMTIKEFLKREFLTFMESPDDSVCATGFFDNRAWLQSLTPNKKIYAVLEESETNVIVK